MNVEIGTERPCNSFSGNICFRIFDMSFHCSSLQVTCKTLFFSMLAGSWTPPPPLLNMNRNKNIKNIEMKARSLNPEMLWEYPSVSTVHIWHLSAAEHNSPAPLSQWDRRPRPLPPPTLSRRGGGVNPLLEQCKEICSERDGGDTCYQRGSTLTERRDQCAG